MAVSNGGQDLFGGLSSATAAAPPMFAAAPAESLLGFSNAPAGAIQPPSSLDLLGGLDLGGGGPAAGTFIGFPTGNFSPVASLSPLQPASLLVLPTGKKNENSF